MIRGWQPDEGAQPDSNNDATMHPAGPSAARLTSGSVRLQREHLNGLLGRRAAGKTRDVLSERMKGRTRLVHDVERNCCEWIEMAVQILDGPLLKWVDHMHGETPSQDVVLDRISGDV